MTFEALLAFLGAFLSVGVGIGVLCKDPRAFVTRAFVVGMLVLAVQGVFIGLGTQAANALDMLRWKRLAWLTTALLPCAWLLFSLSYGRSNYLEILAKRKWLIGAAMALSPIVAFGFGRAFPDVPADWAISFLPNLPLGWAGYLLSVLGLLMAVAILVNLESTFRASTGTKRWHIKFMILGVGSLFAIYIYTISQAILTSNVTPAMQVASAWSTIMVNALIVVSLARPQMLNMTVHLSHIALYNSITMLFVGIYLLAFGLLAKAIQHIGVSAVLPVGRLVVFAALVGLTILLLSDQLRYSLKRFIGQHVYRSRYDYRQVWTSFTERTTAVEDVKELCAMGVKMVSETIGVPSVTIWLLPDGGHTVRLGGSTVFSDDVARPPGFTDVGLAELLSYMQERQTLVDFAESLDMMGEELKSRHPEGFRSEYIRYCVPLATGQECLGLMTLGDQLTGESFTLEDDDLLKTIADQFAASLLRLQLSQRLVHMKQMESFQALSAFFVHDLKNLVSKLSLTLRNLPVHYDKPAFRDDMLHVISGSVAKMNDMCSRLTLMTNTLELHCTEIDLNALVHDTLADLKPSLTVSCVEDLRLVPRLMADPEQLQKVLVNLVLNAHEAVQPQGEIHVVTDRLNGWATLAVHDNGCGISQAFMNDSLFQPFQTTKGEGLGIGLFHSKMIVEAHQGKIEVESEEGKGSTFRVLLRCEESRYHATEIAHSRR